MWIMTTRGFWSVVQHRNNPTLLLVRARCREHLSAFPDREIRHTPDADYLYRVAVTRELFQHIMRREMNAIDYPNFKAAVAQQSGPGNQQRIHFLEFLNSVWCAGATMQTLIARATRRARTTKTPRSMP